MPLQVIWEWQYQSACNGQDTEEFFSPASERGRNRMAREAAAKSLCHRCPVQPQCLDHALEAEESFGIWGGHTHQERKATRAGRDPQTSADPPVTVTGPTWSARGAPPVGVAASSPAGLGGKSDPADDEHNEFPRV